MNPSTIPFLAFLCGALMLAPFRAVADDPSPAELIEQSEGFAYSVDGEDAELVVSVSPTRRTLAILPYGAWVGSAVDTVRNDRFERRIDAALGEFPAGEIFAQAIRDTLIEYVPVPVGRVDEPGSWAGYSSKRAYLDERFERIAGYGAGALLDAQVSYGIYGASGSLVVGMEVDLYSLPDGKLVWSMDFADVGEPIFGTTRVGGDFLQFLPSVLTLDPRLKPEQDAIEQWTDNEAELLVTSYNEAVDGLVEALVTGLGVTEGPRGHFYLGKHFYFNKEFARAAEHFTRALELDPDYIEAKNGLLVAYGKMEDAKRLALDVAHELVEEHPDYGPGWYNLAWLQVFELDQSAEAEGAYGKALDLGMPEHRRMARKIRRATE